MEIRAAIRAEQGWRNWSDTKTADAAGISQSTFSRRMAGRDFKFSELEKLAKAFDMDLSDLISNAESGKVSAS